MIVLEEINNLLNSERLKNLDCISVYDVLCLMREYNEKMEIIINRYKKMFVNKLSQKYDGCSIYSIKFDYEEKTLIIDFIPEFESNKKERISYTSINGNICISNSNSEYRYEFTKLLGENIIELYNILNELSHKQNEVNNIKSINSSFTVYISEPNVRIFESDFQLSSSRDEYICTSNSVNVLSKINGNEEELLKCIFIKISDCPEWTINSLFGFRKKQLDNEKRLREEQKKYEERHAKNQKRLEIIRKVFGSCK